MIDGSFTRVYIEGGTVVHFIDALQSPNEAGSVALCGRGPWPGLWHGTGSQEEEERAMDLRICSQCQAILDHRQNGHLSR